MISSTANKQVKYVNALIKKTKIRKEEGLFVAEGIRICEEIPRELIQTLYISESFQKHPRCNPIMSGVKHVEVVADNVFPALSDTRTPQGVLAVVQQLSYRLEDITDVAGASQARLLMVLEGLQDPGNLGTIVRAGEGAGVHGIIMDAQTADIYNPKVIRSTMGSVFRVPFVYVDNLPLVLEKMKENEICLYAAHLEGVKNYEEADYRGSTAFLIGNEGNGLSEETARMADTYIRIPMAGKVESLNAAVASSILMFEAARQRRL